MPKSIDCVNLIVLAFAVKLIDGSQDVGDKVKVLEVLQPDYDPIKTLLTFSSKSNGVTAII